MVRYAEENRVM